MEAELQYIQIQLQEMLVANAICRLQGRPFQYKESDFFKLGEDLDRMKARMDRSFKIMEDAEPMYEMIGTPTEGTYDIVLSETVQRTFRVHADSADEAIEAVETYYESGKLPLMIGNIIDVKVTEAWSGGELSDE